MGGTQGWLLPWYSCEGQPQADLLHVHPLQPGGVSGEPLLTGEGGGGGTYLWGMGPR